jgi:hypothetical protein
VTISPLDHEELPFLHRMDCIRGETLVVRTTRARLRDASFLDGRERFWTGESLVPLKLRATLEPGVSRFICHVGFCGSTLLARLLDIPGQALVLKEPQCLADIAGQRSAIVAGEAVAPLEHLLAHALDQLGRLACRDFPLVVKPTNWVNSLVPQLCPPGRGVRAVFISMDRRAYLGAVFRGGRERLEFCTRLAAQIAPVVPDGERLLHRAIGEGGDPFDRVARIVVILHALQEALFDSAIAANGWPETARIDFAQLVMQPEVAAHQGRQVLGLPHPATDPNRAARLMERHAKNPASAFDPPGRQREDDEIERHHGARFDAALGWLDTLSGATIR